MTLATKNSYKNSSDRRKLPLSFCRNQNYGAIESIVLFGNSKFSAGLGKRWRFFKVLIIAAHFLQKVGSYYRLSVTNFYKDWSVRKTVLIQKKLVDLIFEFFDGRWKGKNSIALPTPQALTTPTIWNFPLSIVQQEYEIGFF